MNIKKSNKNGPHLCSGGALTAETAAAAVRVGLTVGALLTDPLQLRPRRSGHSSQAQHAGRQHCQQQQLIHL